MSSEIKDQMTSAWVMGIEAHRRKQVVWSCPFLQPGRIDVRNNLAWAWSLGWREREHLVRHANEIAAPPKERQGSF